MGWRVKIGRVAGIDVFVHWTFLFAPLYVVFHSWQYGWAITGLLMVLMLCLFGCVLLHELGHALVGKWFNVATRDIIITPIGGLARLQGMSADKPSSEFLITLAGPAVNLIIALLFLAHLWLTGQTLRPSQLQSFPQLLFWANVFLFAFNLIPAFPMDGGRLLRSVLAMFLPRSTATRIAGNLGRLLALAFVIYGLGNQDLPPILIGLFVFFAANAEMQMSSNTESTE